LKKICWISDFPLRGSSFGIVTYELLTRLPEYSFEVLSLGYQGVPLRVNKNMRILEFRKASQARFYFKKLDPDITVVYHSYYFFDQFREVLPFLKGRRIAYLPIEGSSVPFQYRDIFYSFDKVIVPSNYSKKVLEKIGIKAKVVPHGVDLEFFRPIKKKWHEFRFGYLGMNDIRKQVPRIMEAYSRLKEGILAIASGNEGYDLVSLAKEYNISPVFIETKLNGLKLSREGVRDFLQTLDVYISPASESFGLPALEAQACGVPVIALDHGASREVLGNGALYVKPSDFLHTSVGKVGLISIPELYRKMRFLIQVRNAWEKIREKALENAKKWSWEKGANKLKEILEDV